MSEEYSFMKLKLGVIKDNLKPKKEEIIDLGPSVQLVRSNIMKCVKYDRWNKKVTNYNGTFSTYKLGIDISSEIYKKGIVLLRTKHYGYVRLDQIENKDDCEKIKHLESKGVIDFLQRTNGNSTIKASQKLFQHGDIILDTIPDKVGSLYIDDSKEIMRVEPVDNLDQKKLNLIKKYYVDTK